MISRWVAHELWTIRRLVHQRLVMSRRRQRDVVADFHRLYYATHMTSKIWGTPRWLGVPIIKCPLDLWVLQEILCEIRPDVIVESGTAEGGSALFLASVCDLLGHGRVLTIDVRNVEGRPAHPRITYLRGSSVSDEVVERVRRLVGPSERGLVVLDSDHRKEHVLAELRIYSPLVSPGSYLIVEDTNIGGHPVFPDFGPGPMEAVEEFLGENGDFAVDRSREKFMLTMNPGGFLRRTT